MCVWRTRSRRASVDGLRFLQDVSESAFAPARSSPRRALAARPPAARDRPGPRPRCALHAEGEGHASSRSQVARFPSRDHWVGCRRCRSSASGRREHGGPVRPVRDRARASPMSRGGSSGHVESAGSRGRSASPVRAPHMNVHGSPPGSAWASGLAAIAACSSADRASGARAPAAPARARVGCALGGGGPSGSAPGMRAGARGGRSRGTPGRPLSSSAGWRRTARPPGPGRDSGSSAAVETST